MYTESPEDTLMRIYELNMKDYGNIIMDSVYIAQN